MDYEPIAKIGRGGMGIVELAQDDEGNRVALKRLTLHGSASDVTRARQRLAREADILRRLHHPNIVKLIDVIEEADDMVLVMPYLQGGNLAERVAQHGPAPAADVERLGERLLSALDAAHQAGIIHRDIKPANVMYDAEGEPMLTDFGVAHTWDQTRGLTVTGMVVGTPGYMPPEQARDEPLSPASDVFSVGATLLFAATGQGAYGSGDPALLMVRAANDEVQRLPRSLPKPVRGWLGSMLDPKPENRPTAAALLTGVGLPPRRRQRVRKALVWGGGAATCLAVVFLASGELTGSSDPTDDSGSPPQQNYPDGAGDPGPNPTGANNPPTTDKDDELAELPSLTTELVGELPPPGEPLVVSVPPLPDGPCTDQRTAEVLITLELDPEAEAHVELADSDETLLDEITARGPTPSALSTDQPICPEPGRTLQLTITLLEASPVPSSGTWGAYALSRGG